MKFSCSNLLLLAGTVAWTVGCSTSSSQTEAVVSGPAIETPAIEVDGSSTVYPITTAIAAAYSQVAAAPADVQVEFSGTGGGFEKFCAGETDINNASRPISEAEIAACRAANVRFFELPIAFDALTVVVNRDNDWAEDITLEELKTLWDAAAQGQITQWNQVRPAWPSEPIALYGPGLDSGTYDYFSEVIVGGDTRSDFVASEDDKLLVEQISRDPNALGYFGYVYYEDNQDTLKALAIDSGNGPVTPAAETVVNAEYQPLARPLFIYVNYGSAQNNPNVRKFVQFYLESAAELVDGVGYVPLTEEGYHIASVNFQEGEAGTAFEGQPQPNLTIAELLRKTKRF